MQYLIVQYHTAGDGSAYYITRYSDEINWQEDPEHFFVADANSDLILFMCAVDRLISVSVVNAPDLIKWMMLNRADSVYGVFTTNELRADFNLPPQHDPMITEVKYEPTGNA